MTTGTVPQPRPCVATIGFFDGVHRGHRFLIRQVMEEARRRGLESAVITFDRHPREVLHSDFQPRMLSTTDEKTALLSATGIDRCCILPFTEQLAALSAREFMQGVLRDRLDVRCLIIGYDNRFGHNRAEGFDDYVAYGRELGIEVMRAEAFVLNGVNVSSSVVRSFLSEGEVEMAATCLGYRYALSGTVVGGVREGRRMGYPTANIDMQGISKLIPAHGVYAAVATAGGTDYPAMMNIGNRPTFGTNKTTIEVNLIGFTGNLYGEQLRVSFLRRLRSERRFPSEKELSEQLQRDEAATLSVWHESRNNAQQAIKSDRNVTSAQQE